MVIENVLGWIMSIGAKLVRPIYDRLWKHYDRRETAQKVHTGLYSLHHKRTKTDHPPTFYREVADNLENAIKLDLFPDYQLEYLAECLAEYCYARADTGSTKSVLIDKKHLKGTQMIGTESMRPHDVALIEKHLRHVLEERYSTRIFDHPLDKEVKSWLRDS